MALHLYVWNVLLIIDQAANVVFLGGDPDETISSRLGKRHSNCRVCRWLCWLLDLIDRDHCNKARETDEGSRDVKVNWQRWSADG